MGRKESNQTNKASLVMPIGDIQLSHYIVQAVRSDFHENRSVCDRFGIKLYNNMLNQKKTLTHVIWTVLWLHVTILDFKMTVMKKKLRPYLGFYARYPQRHTFNVDLHAWRHIRCNKSTYIVECIVQLIILYKKTTTKHINCSMTKSTNDIKTSEGLDQPGHAPVSIVNV